MNITIEEARELDNWIEKNVFGREKSFGLKKCGYWYRPDAHGYTDRQSEAWRLTEAEAKKHEYKRGSEPVIMVELDTPRYSADPAHAMAVLEQCADIASVGISNTKSKWFVFSCLNSSYGVEAQTLPLAICLFAKKLFSATQ